MKLKKFVTFQVLHCSLRKYKTSLLTSRKVMLIADLKTSSYFGIMFDSTPNASLDDQISEILRYGKIKDGKVEAKRY